MKSLLVITVAGNTKWLKNALDFKRENLDVLVIGDKTEGNIKEICSKGNATLINKGEVKGVIDSWNMGYNYFLSRPREYEYCIISNDDVRFADHFYKPLFKGLNGGSSDPLNAQFDLMGPMSNESGTQRKQRVGFSIMEEAEELNKIQQQLYKYCVEIGTATTEWKWFEKTNYINGFCFAFGKSIEKYEFAKGQLFDPKNINDDGEDDLCDRLKERNGKVGICKTSYLWHYKRGTVPADTWGPDTQKLWSDIKGEEFGRRIRDKKDLNVPDYWNKAWKFNPDIFDEERSICMKEPIQDGDRILEIGCGMSAFLPYVVKNLKDIKATGLDYSSYAINEMKKLYPSVTWEQGDCYKLPFKDNSFDVVVMAEILEHLEDCATALKEAERVMTPNGRMVITVPDGLKGSGDPEHIRCLWQPDIYRILTKYGKSPVIKVVDRTLVGYNQNLNIKMESPVIVELDDFDDESLMRLPLLAAWKKAVPKLKVTLFAIPAHLTLDLKDQIEREDWIQLVPHGWRHNRLECQGWSKDTAVKYLKLINQMGYPKIFRPPQWAVSEGLYKAIIQENWVICDHKNNRSKRPEGLRVWEIQDREGKDVLHGHITDTMPNSLIYNTSRYVNLTNRCEEFLFVSEDIKRLGI